MSCFVYVFLFFIPPLVFSISASFILLTACAIIQSVWKLCDINRILLIIYDTSAKIEGIYMFSLLISIKFNFFNTSVYSNHSILSWTEVLVIGNWLEWVTEYRWISKYSSFSKMNNGVWWNEINRKSYKSQSHFNNFQLLFVIM